MKEINLYMLKKKAKTYKHRRYYAQSHRKMYYLYLNSIFMLDYNISDAAGGYIV